MVDPGEREEHRDPLPEQEEEEEPHDLQVGRVEDLVDQGLGGLVHGDVEHGLALPAEQGAPVGDDLLGPHSVLHEEEPDGAGQGLEAEHAFFRGGKLA